MTTKLPTYSKKHLRKSFSKILNYHEISHFDLNRINDIIQKRDNNYPIISNDILRAISSDLKYNHAIREMAIVELKKREKDRYDALKLYRSITTKQEIAKMLGVNIKKLNFILYKMTMDDKYNSFSLPKKSGGHRTIHAPCRPLKEIQNKINSFLTINQTPKISSHAFVLGRSIISNASPHVGKKYILNMDLHNFFETINFGRIRGLLKAEPFCLTDMTATIITQFVCFTNDEGRSFLPQGAPTSPILSNMVCLKLDKKLLSFAKANNLFYTRYADDITFSTSYDLNFNDIIVSISNIVLEEGFSINNSKTRLLNSQQRQTVTGLVVNKKVNVSRKEIRNIRSYLYQAEKHKENAQSYYFSHYIKHKRMSPSFYDSLRGKIEFIRHVKGDKWEMGNNLLARFIKLQPARNDFEFIKKHIYLLATDKIDYLTFSNALLNTKLDLSHLINEIFKVVLLLKDSNDSRIADKSLSYYEFISTINLSETDFEPKDILSYVFNNPEDIIKSETRCHHNAKNVARFFSLFHSQNNKRLRELVHKSNNNDLNLDVIVKQASKELSELGNSDNDIGRIPLSLYIHVQDELIKYYDTYVIPLWKLYHENPLFNKSREEYNNITKHIVDFKKNYKLGSKNNIDETPLSVLIMDVLTNVFKDKLTTIELVFSHSDNDFVNHSIVEFDHTASFYSHIPRIKTALIIILQNICNHSCDSSRLLFDIRVEEDNDYDKYILSIKHSDSAVNKKISRKTFSGGDSLEACKHLWSLCDWNIYCYSTYDNRHYKISMLPSVGNIISAIELDRRDNGFIHELIFYQHG